MISEDARRRVDLVQTAVAKAVLACIDQVPGLTDNDIADALAREARVRDEMRPNREREPERTRTAIGQATRLAGLALTDLDQAPRSALRVLPDAVRERLIVHAAVAFLLGAGLVEPTEVLSANEPLSLNLPDPYRADFAAALDEALASQARIAAALEGP